MARCRWRARAGIPVGVVESEYGPPAPAYGVMIAGVPVGEPLFVRVHTDRAATEVESIIRRTCEGMEEHSHALWSLLYSCCQTRFDYMLRHVLPCDAELRIGCIIVSCITLYDTLIQQLYCCIKYTGRGAMRRRCIN